MERLFFHGLPSDELNFAKYQSSSEWHLLYEILRHGYWHVTTPAGWAAIRESGVIRPNREASKARFCSAENSYSLIHGCVALFDFATPAERVVILNWGFTWDVIGQTCPGVLLQFDKARLDPRIIPNSEGCRRADGKFFHCIEHCEVWYPDDIPIDTVTACYQVDRGDDVGLQLVLLMDEKP